MKIHKFSEIPAGFLDLDPRELYTILPGPSLIEIKGVVKSPLFISTLLHGNETSGVYALQKLLRRYCASDQPLPRSMSIFIGNVFAAKEARRTLEGQLDYNRVWSGGESPEHQMAEEIKNYVAECNVFACIDIHNNTGWNPYYTCVNTLEIPYLNFARMFSRRVVYFNRPSEVLSIALKAISVAVTIEAGQSGDMAGIERLVDFLEQAMQLREIPRAAICNDDFDIYHSVARIKVPEDCSIHFDQLEQQQTADFQFVPNFECLNFMELPEHTLLGWRKNNNHHLLVIDESGKDVSDDFIQYQGDEIRTKRPTVPSMFCTNETIIRQDCLGYFMQRYRL